MSRVFRIVALGLVFAQIVLEGPLVVVDGMKAAQSPRGSVSHIETQAAQCPQVHRDDCVVCHFMAHGGGVPERRGAGQILSDVGAEAIRVGATYVPARFLAAATLPRAPPAV